MDKFAEIARQKVVSRESLTEVTPKKFVENKVSLKKVNQKPSVLEKNIDNKNDLYALLKTEREKYKPFLQDFSPSLKYKRKITYLTDFTVDGKKVKIPNYEGPVGYAKKVYQTVLTVDNKKTDKSYWLHFNGVDYIAVVFVNGEFVGRHEGFFSPFEFDVTAVIKEGENDVKIEVFNDYIYGGNDGASGISYEGDKLYAATGIGWDGAYDGWHHCPPGMGIYGEVYLEERSEIYISDLFARPLVSDNCVELWIEAYNCNYSCENLTFNVSVYGQNFEETVIENVKYSSKSDDLVYLVKDGEDAKYELQSQKGENLYKIIIDMPNAKLWRLNSPYLYNAKIELIVNGEVIDAKERQFGMRSFSQDTVSDKKGAFYLNGEKIKLRGANTMGFEQQDVIKGDIEQLIDDILLAKICNMNFLRITQRPVQDKIYEYCDKLGLMTQTDLPLFGVMRRTKFAEGVRQAEEMEKLVRSHPCNALDSFINEPFPNARNKPHRHLMRDELSNFFISCEYAVKLNNPDRVIKYVDGDYDPPSDNMPDNHCYNLWYNGHCLDVGKLIKGYWCEVKPNWFYGCGEFGIEGLDFEEIMREYYPKEWLAEPFDPKHIVGSQTGSFYRYFYPRPKNITEWVERSLTHQAQSLKIMTEAFRRNDDMVTFAVHLFIDAWPSGWMKTIMDFKRNPKPAYFAYRNALAPVLVSLRTDRFTYFAGEEIKIETHLCNDLNESKNYNIVYEVINENNATVFTSSVSAVSKPVTAEYVATCAFSIDSVNDRETFTVRASLFDGDKTVNYNEQKIEVFEKEVAVESSDKVVFVKLDVGEHYIAGEKVVVKDMETGANFMEIVENALPKDKFRDFDFRYWYDKNCDYITPVVTRSFKCDGGFNPILLTANHEPTDCWVEWNTEYAAAIKEYEGKIYFIYTADFRRENPIADRFINYINGLSK